MEKTFNSVRRMLVRWLQTPEEKQQQAELLQRCETLERELAQMLSQKEMMEVRYQEMMNEFSQRCLDLEQTTTKLLEEAKTLQAYCGVNEEVKNYIHDVLSRPEEVRWLEGLVRSKAQRWVESLSFDFEIH